MVQTTPPYKYEGLQPIEGIKHILSFYLFFILIFSPCCSSYVSMAFEDALAGLPNLGQPKVRLP
jgi:hypothetical protein